MDYHLLPRKDLQLLCKKHGIPANKTNVFMAEALAKKRVPLSDITVNREADNDLFAVTPLKVSAAKSNDVNGALFNNTPFLRRGTKKREGAPARSTDGAEERVEVSAAAPSHSSRLAQDGVCNAVSETSTRVGGAALRGESKSLRSTKEITASVKQKPEDKSSGQLRAAGGQPHQSEIRRGGKSESLGSGSKATTELKPCTSSAAVAKTLKQPANAEVVDNKERGGKASPHHNPINGAFEQEDSESNDSYTLETRRSSSESSFTSADQEDTQPKKVENSEEEAGFVSDTAQPDLGQDLSVEGNQRGESEPGRSQTPPRQRYIVKVTFADEVSIMGKGSGGVEKGRLDESKLRRPDTLPITNGGYAVKSKLDTRPATNWPFVFRATRQEETKPRNSKTASRVTSDLKGRAESKSSVAGALKQDESKARRAGSEGREAEAAAKLKAEVKTSAVLVSSSYSKPSKRPRFGSGSNVDSSPTDPDVEAADSFEFPAPCSEFKIVDLPEWAKEFKRKREETSTSAVAHAGDESTNIEMVPLPAPGLSPLKKIEDTVVKLLDRLKRFCWKAEVDAVTLETEAANEVIIAVEAADQIEV